MKPWERRPVYFLITHTLRPSPRGMDFDCMGYEIVTLKGTRNRVNSTSPRCPLAVGRMGASAGSLRFHSRQRGLCEESFLYMELVQGITLLECWAQVGPICLTKQRWTCVHNLSQWLRPYKSWSRIDLMYSLVNMARSHTLLIELMACRDNWPPACAGPVVRRAWVSSAIHIRRSLRWLLRRSAEHIVISQCLPQHAAWWPADLFYTWWYKQSEHHSIACPVIAPFAFEQSSHQQNLISADSVHAKPIVSCSMPI